MAADGMRGARLSSSDALSMPDSVPDPHATHVRSRSPVLTSRAARRVAEYLRTLGLSDADRIRKLAEHFASETAVDDPEAHAHRAVSLAQESYKSWRSAVFSWLSREPDPLWLRAFVAAVPEVFLEEPRVARAAARRFGDPEEGLGPVRAHFSVQKLEPLRLPGWLEGLLPPSLFTAGASFALLVALGADGLAAVELAWVSLFTFLFGFAAIGFFSALKGVLPHARRQPPAAEAEHESKPPLPRSALLMPVYHESAEQVFAALAAMRESLLATPGGEAFEIFVLSDSRDAALAAEEERAFRRVTANAGEGIPIFYRRRAKNTRQKAGNLQEFFERWGYRYDYVVVLDADSLMTGPTLVELVRRMEASPRLALLQAPIALAGGETLFARALQFSTSLCGPAFTRGLARWSGPHGNYYGHNAAIRVKAFLECCSLPRLDGEPPLGGHILSHDFVEAALLCRAGWEVRIADDLGGSFEGIPPTLPEYVARDRRWCQGNLQHLRVALAQDLRPMSRLHLLFGVAAYLAGPAWLAFLIFGLLLSRGVPPAYIEIGGLIMASTAVLLFGPRLLGFLVTAANGASRRAHGGIARLFFGTLAELLLAAGLAPILMLHHTRIVLSILFGRAVGWGAQRRRAVGQFGSIVRSHAWIMLAGVGLFFALRHFAPNLVVWLLPIWLPWSLAIPIAAFASSPRAGRVARSLGLLIVPNEVEPEPLIRHAEELCTLTASDQAARFRDLVLDPVLVEAHLARLGDARSKESEPRLAELRQRALRAGPAGLTEAEREALSRDAESMRWLHREAWRHWPVESWGVSRERPQVPPQSNPLATALAGPLVPPP